MTKKFAVTYTISCSHGGVKSEVFFLSVKLLGVVKQPDWVGPTDKRLWTVFKSLKLALAWYNLANQHLVEGYTVALISKRTPKK